MTEKLSTNFYSFHARYGKLNAELFKMIWHAKNPCCCFVLLFYIATEEQTGKSAGPKLLRQLVCQPPL